MPSKNEDDIEDGSYELIIRNIHEKDIALSLANYLNNNGEAERAGFKIFLGKYKEEQRLV